MSSMLVRPGAVFGVLLVSWMAAACGEKQPPPAPPTYCEVNDIIGRRCSTCHATEPQFGAPMSLMLASDFVKPAVLTPNEQVWQAVKRRIHDTAHPMPPGHPMSADELAALDRWLDSAGHDSGACAQTPLATDFVAAGPESLPCEPDIFVTASKGATDGTSLTTEKYAVPVLDDKYTCFGVRLPARQGRLVTALAPVIDDSRVVHHMILYHDPENKLSSGPHSCGERSNASMPVMLWGPGAGGMVLPGDVGLSLGDGELQFDLEVHYNNARRLEDAVDASGFALCSSTRPRKYTAAVGTVGTVSFTIPAASPEGPGALSLTNVCDPPQLHEPTRILATAPHMHALGVSMKTEILRADDTVETLIDVPRFDFNDQSAHPVDKTLYEHDRLRTTCAWSNPKEHPTRYGGGTNDEMCFNFLLYYPAGQLGVPGIPAEACIDPVEVLSHKNP